MRSAITVPAALSASSVAPAQVTENAEPLIAAGSGVMPVPAVIQTLENESFKPVVGGLDPLAPQPEAAEPEQTAEAEAPARDLPSLVAHYRGRTPAAASWNASPPASISNRRASRLPASWRSAM